MSKCKLKTCLNNEKGECDIGAACISKIILNSIKCPFFDDDFDKSYKDFKAHGGMMGAIAKMKGKKLKTEKELKNIKKAKRKPRNDVGEKRGPRKKKDNTLGEFL